MAARRKVKKSTAQNSVNKRSVKTQISKTWIVVGVILGLFVIAGLYSYQQKNAVPAEVFVVDQPNTFSFADKFGDGTLGKGRWRVAKADGVTITETKLDNLRIVVPEGAVNNRPRNGAIVAKEVVSSGQDFRASARIYKPVVSGTGAVGRVGIAFTGGEDETAEGAQVYWEVGVDGSSKLTFYTKIGSAEPRVQSVDVNAKQVQVALRREGSEYMAFYRADNFDDDNPLLEIGESVMGSANIQGRLRLFARNGANNTFGKVVARFDSTSMNSNLNTSVMRDTFRTDGALDPALWLTTVRAGQDPEKRNGNLRLSIGATAAPNVKTWTPAVSRATAKVEVKKDKRGVAVVEMIKPSVEGAGYGISGVVFNSEGQDNDESAGVRWIVGNGSSKLVFVVKDAKGKLIEKASRNISPNANRVTVRLRHGDDVYSAMYRVGPGLDDDKGFRQLGSERNPKVGAKGRFSLITTQERVGNSAPAVIARFDSFRIVYE